MTLANTRTDMGDQALRFIPDLKRYAHALTRNRADADDLLQESLMRAIAKSHLFSPGSDLKAWLFTIMRNLSISEFRRRGRGEIPMDPDYVSSCVASPPNQEHRVMLRSLDAAFHSLPRAQREPLALAALDGLSYEEISVLLDVPLGTLKSRISRGRAVLRSILGETPLKAAFKAPRFHNDAGSQWRVPV